MNNVIKSKETGAKTKRNRPDVQIYRPPAIRNTPTSTSKTVVNKSTQSTRKTTKSAEVALKNSAPKSEVDLTMSSNSSELEIQESKSTDDIQSHNLNINEHETQSHQSHGNHLDSSEDKDTCTNETKTVSLEEEVNILTLKEEILGSPESSKNEIQNSGNLLNKEKNLFKNTNKTETISSVIKTTVHLENSKNNSLHQTNKLNNDSALKISEIKMNKPISNENKIYSLTNKKPDKETDDDVEEFLRASEGLNRCNKRLVKNSLNQSDILIIEDSAPSEDKVDDWEELLDDNKFLDSSLFTKSNKGNENISRTLTRDDSRDMRRRNVDSSMTHIIEIYGFPTEFQTRDLITIFEHHRPETFHIKWVDDNHALGVFPSESVASEVLKIQHPLIKLRPMSEASKQAIMKAKKNPNALLPVMARPQTCPQTARRMVTGALGLKLRSSKEEREKERQILKEAREKKRLALRQADDAWEGKISSLHQ